MGLGFRFAEDDDIRKIGKFVFDEANNRYGFTLVLKSGNIQNYFVQGSYIELKNEIRKLCEKYNDLEYLVQRNRINLKIEKNR